MIETKLNVRLLRRIQAHILREPKRLFMSHLVLRRDNCLIKKGRFVTRYPTPNSWGESDPLVPECGTVACIAGWACELTPKHTGNYTMKDARLYLSLPAGYGRNDLFMVSGWPEPFKSQYSAARTPTRRVKVAVARIDHLIATGE